MKGAITWEQVVTLIVILSALAGAWWFLFAGILSLRRDLNEFRLKVAEDYASREHLKEVETRLVVAVDKLAEELDSLPNRIAAVLAVVKQNQ